MAPAFKSFHYTTHSSKYSLPPFSILQNIALNLIVKELFCFVLQKSTDTSNFVTDKFYIIFTVHFLQFTNYTPKKCTIFSLYILYSSTPTHVSAFTRPSSGGSRKLHSLHIQCVCLLSHLFSFTVTMKHV
jgi:hypothetical protein